MKNPLNCFCPSCGNSRFLGRDVPEDVTVSYVCVCGEVVLLNIRDALAEKARRDEQQRERERLNRDSLRVLKRIFRD